MHRGAWRATVHGFAKSRTQLSDTHKQTKMSSGQPEQEQHAIEEDNNK